MGKIRSIALLLIFSLCIFLFSCGRFRREEFRLFSGDFSSEYSYFSGEVRIRAALTSIKRTDGREITLSFIEPKTLEGLVCTSFAGEFRAELAGVCVEGTAAESLAASATLFGESQLRFCERIEGRGEMLEHFKGILADGTEVSVYIEGRTGIPVKISGNVQGRFLELDIISFEKLGG